LISLIQEHNEPLLEAVANGDFDAGIVGMGVQPLPARIRTRVVATEPLVLAVRRGDPLSRRRTVTLAQLRERSMITLIRGSGLRTVLENACRDVGFAPRITAEAGELGSLVELAAKGSGQRSLPLQPRREPTSPSSRSPGRAFGDIRLWPGTRRSPHPRGTPSWRSPTGASTPGARGTDAGYRSLSLSPAP
jgi:DNA-binding transcriptional LysR family regulator